MFKVEVFELLMSDTPVTVNGYKVPADLLLSESDEVSGPSAAVVAAACGEDVTDPELWVGYHTGYNVYVLQNARKLSVLYVGGAKNTLHPPQTTGTSTCPATLPNNLT